MGIDFTIAEHEQISAEIAECEKQLTELRESRQQLVNRLFEQHGKGPFDWNGGRIVISSSRSGNKFLAPVTKKKKKKD